VLNAGENVTTRRENDWIRYLIFSCENFPAFPDKQTNYGRQAVIDKHFSKQQ
jgi:hypothetical protein